MENYIFWKSSSQNAHPLDMILELWKYTTQYLSTTCTFFWNTQCPYVWQWQPFPNIVYSLQHRCQDWGPLATCLLHANCCSLLCCAGRSCSPQPEHIWRMGHSHLSTSRCSIPAPTPPPHPSWPWPRAPAWCRACRPAPLNCLFPHWVLHSGFRFLADLCRVFPGCSCSLTAVTRS